VHVGHAHEGFTSRNAFPLLNGNHMGLEQRTAGFAPHAPALFGIRPPRRAAYGVPGVETGSEAFEDYGQKD
jgi:hypothetical protein